MSPFYTAFRVIQESNYTKGELQEFFPYVQVLAKTHAKQMQEAGVSSAVIADILEGPKGNVKKEFFEQAFATVFASRELLDFTIDSRMPQGFRALFMHLLVNEQIMALDIIKNFIPDVFDVVKNNSSYSYSYSTTKRALKPFLYFFKPKLYMYEVNEGTILLIPTPLLMWLRTLLPRPEAAIVKIANTAPEGLKVFSAEARIFSDIAQIAEGKLSGMIAVGKNGNYLDGSLKKAQEAFGIPEFYDKTVGEKTLFPLRMRTILTLLDIAGVRKNGLEQLQAMFNAYQDAAAYTTHKGYHEANELLPHLTGLPHLSTWSDELVPVSGQVLKILRQYADGSWIDIDNLANTLAYDQQALRPFSKKAANRHVYYVRKGRYGNEKCFIDESSYLSLISTPMLRGSLVLLASLGMLDVAYTTPDTTTLGDTYYSYFDGFKAFKVNELGRFMLGISKTYAAPKVETGVEITLSNTDLMVLLSKEFPPKEGVLSLYAEKINSRRFLVSNASFLKNCTGRKDLETRISSFNHAIDNQKLPKNWNDFFEQLRSKVVSFTPEDVVVLQLPVRNKALVQLIATHPDFKDIALKAENMKIIVANKSLKKFKDLLKQHGYLLD